MTEAPLGGHWPTTLVTSRLTLRPMEHPDLPAIVRLWTDAEVRRHLGGPVDKETVRARKDKCIGAPGAFSVVRHKDGAVVGLVSVEQAARDGRTEISYQMLPEHWGHGYARESVASAVAWASARVPSQAPGIVAETQAANSPSRRLLEDLGATLADSFVEWGAAQVLYVLR
ncbi:GNAT family N-acetyltransferase [Streptomyces sp. NPDC002889]|uniref:GNAT family N-acetyltransferase n=1 Tax=Streptomyces sp. NPDC002889 TaxID=3364669 RepID=UPI003687C59B